MRLDICKFGETLLSRPNGREAFLAARAYSIPKEGSEPIELDFSRVKVLTPSWADEFLSGLRHEYGAARIKIIEGDNASVQVTLAVLRESNTAV
ncbi:STAS-like domain-containing protein [Candidatus Uhrbacteria bacterium]|nr:STAS-like domain-containing protein [Candidatus Uhrbacteria bacterium]